MSVKTEYLECWMISPAIYPREWWNLSPDHMTHCCYICWYDPWTAPRTCKEPDWYIYDYDDKSRIQRYSGTRGERHILSYHIHIHTSNHHNNAREMNWYHDSLCNHDECDMLYSILSIFLSQMNSTPQAYRSQAFTLHNKRTKIRRL